MIAMKRLRHFLAALFLFIITIARADEGMWLPLFLQQLNEKDMKAKGMKISAKDIYNINSGSLKDAIVSFGGFCTGEVISAQGLVLTNHHCGFDAIQNHSTLDNNYIRDGFWAKSNNEEIPNPGLFVTFIVRIEDISKQVLAGVAGTMSEKERQAQTEKNVAELIKTVKKENYQQILVRPFFEGNQYFMFITERYNDVRLVGAPPSSIGNFGKDTDNWMWPRHTGDFSMFRIYAGKDNKPADYSPDNVPYVPKKSLSISLDGVSENDFTMVFGFPGRTMEYLPAIAVDQTVRVGDPVKIAIRDKALNVIDGFMRKDEQIKIQYSEKYGESGLNNALPQTIARLQGVYNEYNSIVDKKQFEILMEMFAKDQDEKFISPALKEKAMAAGGYAKLAEQLYSISSLDEGEKIMSGLNNNATFLLEEHKKDPINILFKELAAVYGEKVSVRLNELQAEINKLQRSYMQAQMDVFKEKKFYPDANGTLRVTYGNVKGYNARDAVTFDYYSYLDGIIEKYKPGDYEFDVPDKLRQLQKTKDFGQYGVKGKMPVCFIAANHTTGGNSGSPALDAYGNLVGLNFDRVWEGTMSDINFDPTICRNIMVDIRYVLFIVDKFAGAPHLVKEMKLVHPKKK